MAEHEKRTPSIGGASKRPQADAAPSRAHASACRVVSRAGLEPELTGPKPVVLPITPPGNAWAKRIRCGGSRVKRCWPRWLCESFPTDAGRALIFPLRVPQDEAWRSSSRRETCASLRAGRPRAARRCVARARPESKSEPGLQASGPTAPLAGREAPASSSATGRWSHPLPPAARELNRTNQPDHTSPGTRDRGPSAAAMASATAGDAGKRLAWNSKFRMSPVRPVRRPPRAQ